ncbi:715_t:CDS:2 [Entrophospora sp. SA101]|nr:715_t:CDS:2 [Entrophospora sp. SA101]
MSSSTMEIDKPLKRSGGISMDELGDESMNYELSESSKKARDEHQAILDEFERQKRARTLAVPTDDGRVRAKLKELGEPQCLFGEGPGDRRDRLRYLLSKMEGTKVITEGESESESESEEEKEEEFFTPGSIELLNARRWIAHYSLPKAKDRLKRQRIESELPIPQLKSVRKELFSGIKSYSNFSSQIGDDRPISQCNFSPDCSMVATGSWSGLCRIWSVPNCDSAWNDMINSNVKLCAIQIPLSTGYFFADMLDFLIKNIFMDSPGIWLHHILVVGVLISSILTCKYFPYLTATLLVEIVGGGENGVENDGGEEYWFQYGGYRVESNS